MSGIPKLADLFDSPDNEAINVLVVEDEELVAEMYQEWLSDAGCSVKVAEGGREALKKVDGKTDVVLLDRRMPYISGDVVLDVVRSEDIHEMNPERFKSDDPYHLENEDTWDKDVRLESAKKLDKEVVKSIQGQDIDCLVCMVTAVRPDFEIIDMEFDHYIVKQINSVGLVKIVEGLASLSEVDETVRKYQSIRWKMYLLEDSFTASELEVNEPYQKLKDRVERIESEGGEKIQRIKEIEFG